MAEPKKNSGSKPKASQAQKAASQAGKKTTNVKSKTPKEEVSKENQIPVRLISSLVILVLFVLFFVILLKPEGVFLEFIYEKVILGLVGKVGFYLWVPALLYLFVIHAFSGKKPIIMRSICLCMFVICCGCVAHLALSPKDLPEGKELISALYRGGIANTTGGLLCGGLAHFSKMFFGQIFSYLIFIVTAIICLFATFRITIVGIVRAIQERPRAEWEEEEPETPKPEPSAVVVNHIVTRHHEQVEKKRMRQAERELAAVNLTDAGKKTRKSKVADMMSQIDSDVSAPVAAASLPVEDDSNTEEIKTEQHADPAVASDVPSQAELIVSEPKTETPEPEKRVEIPEVQESEIPASMPPLDIEPDSPFAVFDLPLPVEEEAEEEVQEEEWDDTEILTAPVAVPEKVTEPSVSEKVTAKSAAESAEEIGQEIAKGDAKPKPVYSFPPIDLLNAPKSSGNEGMDEMVENSKRLNETLESFRIEAHIINVTRGPSVTRYEVELDKGVRLNKLTTCADDIALSLGASGVRIAAVPGKISVVGIEVPNRAVTPVSLREVVDSKEFSSAKSKSSFAVGKDIGGTSIVGNISKLPHMLIAGTTGAGKSVCMNSVIISLLYKASPEDVRLIMVDPKMVELGIYNGIPHLLIPVVTDPKKAAGSLQWAVTEMLRRYRAMSDMGVRDLEAYNSIVAGDETAGEKLPQVVVIIDELADLMLVAAKEVEESICRIAQMGRAAGIHLIIATQRPSADVITGLMKANIPSRIAFAVASAMESRIILDTPGAEKLVGKGDMLYAPIGCGKPKRVQGCFVSEEEVEAVATYVKNNYLPSYDAQIMEEIEQKAAQADHKSNQTAEPEPNADELGADEMLPAAVDVILETGQASVSMLQRRLKLGYARAARIVDEMEERGIVGPFKGSKPREILITKEQWQAMSSGQPVQMEFDDYPLDDGEEAEIVSEEME